MTTEEITIDEHTSMQKKNWTLFTSLLLVFALCISCHQLRPLTVVQHELDGSHDTDDLDTFLR